MPSEINNHQHLKTLQMQRNAISGHIPPAIAGLHKLEVFDVENNKFIGSIPDIDTLSLLTKIK